MFGKLVTPTTNNLGPPTSYYHDDEYRWWLFVACLALGATTALAVGHMSQKAVANTLNTEVWIVFSFAPGT